MKLFCWEAVIDAGQFDQIYIIFEPTYALKSTTKE